MNVHRTKYRTLEELAAEIERDDSTRRKNAKAKAHAQEALRLLGIPDPYDREEDVSPPDRRR